MIERDELLKMAEDAGFEVCKDRKGDPYAWVEGVRVSGDLERFMNAILERAALECDDQWSKRDEFEGKQAVDCCSNAVRALKTKE